MAIPDVNFIAVGAAAAASFGFGAVWYGVLGKAWMAALHMSEQPKPSPVVFAITLIALLVMAFFMAGLIGHLGEVSITSGLLTGFFCWLAFIATTLCINHRFQSATWRLTIIDGGHWLGVLGIQGLIIGLFGG